MKITYQDLLSVVDLHQKFLSGDKKGEQANLRGADLYGINLTGTNLKGAILEGASLRPAVLWGTNLAEAVLEGTNLKHAILEDANLNGAWLNPTAVIKAVTLVDRKPMASTAIMKFLECRADFVLRVGLHDASFLVLFTVW
jgi:uncharacterized protein YjbI with pentapeptide repeats